MSGVPAAGGGDVEERVTRRLLFTSDDDEGETGGGSCGGGGRDSIGTELAAGPMGNTGVSADVQAHLDSASSLARRHVLT